jgi:hypothetical protein
MWFPQREMARRAKRGRSLPPMIRFFGHARTFLFLLASTACTGSFAETGSSGGSSAFSTGGAGGVAGNTQVSGGAPSAGGNAAIGGAGQTGGASTSGSICSPDCDPAAQYCYSIVGGAIHTPVISCQALPSTCGATPSCTCLSSVCGSCTQSAIGVLTKTCLAP